MLDYKLVTILEGLIIIQDVVFSFVEKLKNSNRIYKLIAFAVMALVLIAVSVFSSGVKLTYNVILDGEILANVSSKAVYSEALDIALDQVSGDVSELTVAQLKSVVSINEETDSAKEVSELILKNSSSIYYGYEVVVGKEIVGYVNDISIFEDARDKKLASYNVKDAECESNFTVNVAATPAYFTAENLSRADDIETALSNLDVMTIATTDKTYTVKYETSVKKDSSKYAGYQSVLKKGSNGTSRTTKQTTYLNGVAVSEPIVKNEVIKDPVNEIIVVGTKNVYVTSAPQNASSSGFKWPLSTVGVLTSTYGEVRNNGTKIHGALDIAVPQGTSVIAVKGGTVVEAAYESGYGNYVVIDHGNGLKTLYAHNKRIVVSKGQKVTAGQLIALSGNTGRSTGPHLHFEVILNGNKVNPGNYLDMSKFK